MSSYHCRFDDKDRTAASGFYDVADRLLTDELKNSILDKAGIPLLRLSTDGSNEKNKIINALSR